MCIELPSATENPIPNSKGALTKAAVQAFRLVGPRGWLGEIRHSSASWASVSTARPLLTHATRLNAICIFPSFNTALLSATRPRQSNPQWVSSRSARRSIGKRRKCTRSTSESTASRNSCTLGGGSRIGKETSCSGEMRCVNNLKFVGYGGRCFRF